MSSYSKAVSQRTIFTLLLAVLTLTACSSSRELMPTPNLSVRDSVYTAPRIEDARPDPALKILYVTDRANSQPDAQYAQYDKARSSSLAFGVASVHFSPEVDGAALARGSSSKVRKPRLRYAGVSTNELGRFPRTPYPFSISQGRVTVDESTLEKINKANAELSGLLKGYLKTNESSDVVLFVHGFNNSFEYAAQTLAGIWHFLGRKQVPLLYSWPAGYGGIRGYFIDRESGEFTIFHLKEVLRALSAIPEIKNLHIIAHSRGTDVVTTALRELLIESRGSQSSFKEDFRIANLILAAPDIDYGVMQQRLMAEAFGTGFKRITVYTTANDKALSVSQLLMRGLRFGRLGSKNIEPGEKAILEVVGNVDFVQALGVKTLTGHDYFISNPAVSSDLLTVINYSVKPGGTLRPLIHAGGNFWLLPDDYLASLPDQKQ